MGEISNKKQDKMKARIILLVVFFTLLNALSPLRDIEIDNTSAFSRTLASQPVISCFFVLSNLPIHIVSSLINEQNPLTSSLQETSPHKKQKPKKNSSSDFSLLDTLQKLDVWEISTLVSAGSNLSLYVQNWSDLVSCLHYSPPPELLFILLCLLMFFIVLARSGISGEFVRLFGKGAGAQLDFSSWVFCLLGMCIDPFIFGETTYER
jgi:hypothetical protein